MTIVAPPQVVTDYLRHIPRLELDRAGFRHLDAWLGRSQDPALLDNGTPLALPDDLLEVIDRLDIQARQSRTGLAAQAVWDVSHHQNSALKAQWEHGLRFSEWTTHLWGVHDRLLNQATTLAT